MEPLPSEKQQLTKEKLLRAKIDTTLGELIEAVSEAAADYCEDAAKTYALASLVLTEMLKHTPFFPPKSTFRASPIVRRQELWSKEISITRGEKYESNQTI